jgi:hypothetical protein
MGEKSNGLCKTCRKLVPTTFKVDSVPFAKGKGKVFDILVAKCDLCDSTLSIPQQSSPKAKEALSKRYSLEVRIPIHMRDILIQASHAFKRGTPDTLLRYYISLGAQEKSMTKRIVAFSKSEVTKGSNFRLSLKLSSELNDRFELLRKSSKLSKTEVIKAIIWLINEELLQNLTTRKKALIEHAILASA